AIGPAAAPAADALGKVLVNDKFESVRLAAAYALGELGEEAGDAAKALGQALQDPDDEVRQEAAFALGEFGDAAEPLLPALRKAADNDPAEVVRQAAKDAIDKLTEEDDDDAPKKAAPKDK
ncbi:MAG: HEAT repeat domain-containing protein, partial [Isosphaeraceae bacterium]|nr:HEAT repeat domain-containing protein [Isosphaeraceae bacterium]